MSGGAAATPAVAVVELEPVETNGSAAEAAVEFEPPETNGAAVAVAVVEAVVWEPPVNPGTGGTVVVEDVV